MMHVVSTVVRQRMGLRPHVVLLLVLASLFYGSAMANDNSMKGLEIKMAKVLSSGSIVVTINNSSKLPIKVWKESNSWGAARWRVLLVRNGQLELFFQNPNQLFTRNIPTFNEVAGEAQIEQKLDLNGGNWCRLDYCTSYDERGVGGKNISFEPQDKIFVIYDVPRTDEAINMGVWYGVVAAAM
jgi:hypothetical protein